jgi:hypothetical protein
MNLIIRESKMINTWTAIFTALKPVKSIEVRHLKLSGEWGKDHDNGNVHIEVLYMSVKAHACDRLE